MSTGQGGKGKTGIVIGGPRTSRISFQTISGQDLALHYRRRRVCEVGQSVPQKRGGIERESLPLEA
jgi:hypothetical protein